jgi:hypothetical protein
MADVNQQILEALDAGYGPEDILSHIKSKSEDSPAHAAWYKKYQQNSMDARASNPDVDMTPDITNPNDMRVPPVMTQDPFAKPIATGQTAPASGNIVSSVAKDLNNWYQTTPAWQKGAEVAGLGAATVAGYHGIRAGINHLFPGPGVAVQQKQNELKAQELEIERQRLAAGDSGELSPLEQARLETEKARAEQIRANIARQAKLDEMKAAQAAQPKLSAQDQALVDLANAQAAAKTNMAPRTAAGVVPPTTGLNAGIVPSAAGQVPNVETPATPAMPEPTITTPPRKGFPENMPQVIRGYDDFQKIYPELYEDVGKPNSPTTPETATPTATIEAAPVTPTAVETAPVEAAPTEAPKEAAAPTTEVKAGVQPKAEEVAKAETKAKAKLKWPGGAEGFALQQLGATKKTFSEQHAAALELLKDRTNGILTQSASGGGIHQMEDLSKMYEHYTGEPLAKTAEGKWARTPDAQVAKLHAGINSDLQDAVKGGKLKTLGKGAMAAAALLGLTDAVQAAQKGDFGPLKEAGFDLGVGALGGPAVMAAQAALTGKTVASGLARPESPVRQELLSRPGVSDYLATLRQNVSPQEFNKISEAYLASNPNAPQSDFQKYVQFVQRDIAKRSGAGRGIAPPSAYQR